MTDAFDIYSVDFDALYRGAPLMEGVAGDLLPWDIGGPQSAVVDLERAGRIVGDVVDIGCGLGCHAIFLASRGYRVTGLDGATTAIQRATEQARAQNVDVEFAVADATDLRGYQGRFDTALDSALYHCFDEDARKVYAAELYRATKPGALLNLLCGAAEELPPGLGVTEDNLRTTLTAAGWTITDLCGASYYIPAAMTTLVDAFGVDTTPDDAGHLALPIWVVQGERT